MPSFNLRETDNLHVKKKFKFYHIRWNVDNFFAQCCQENWELCSPNMDGPGGSKLMLVLKRALNHDRTFSCLVRRSASDPGPETVLANFDLGFFGKHVNFPSFKKNRLHSFNKGSEYETTFEINFTGMERICKDYFMSDWFYIESRIITYIECEGPGLEEYVDIGLKSLSEDMLALYQSSLAYDIELKFGDRSIKAHKAILYTRWPFMQHIIDKLKIGRNVDLTARLVGIDFETLERIMAVIYTGDTKYALDKPSLALYKIVNEMDVSELKKYYCEEHLIFASSIDSQEFIFEWSIRDFSSVLENNKYLVSPVFTDYDSNRTWKLHFYSQKYDHGDYVAISVETNEEIKSSNIWLEISAYDKDGDLTLINILRRHADGRKMIRFKALAYRDWIRTCAVNDVLSIAIKLKLSTGRQHTVIQKRSIHSVYKSWTDIPYKMLSVHLEKLFISGLYSNAVIETKNAHALPIHKCILAARCKGLYDILMSNGEEKYIINEDLSMDILFLVFDYIYSGSFLYIKDDARIFEIGEFAESVHFSRLQEICSMFLSEYMKKHEGCKKMDQPKFLKQYNLCMHYF